MDEKRKETTTIMASHGLHLPLSHLGLRRRSRRTSFPSPSDQPPRRCDLPRPTAIDRQPTAHSDPRRRDHRDPPRPTADLPPTQTPDVSTRRDLP